jgi:hypothetical protein
MKVVKQIVVVCVLFLALSSMYAMDPPIAYWNFDETEGVVAADAIGELHGEWVGTPVWVPEGGHAGGAIECNDDSSFIAVYDAPGLFDELGSEFTFSVWVAVYEFSQDWQGIIFQNDKFFLERNNSSSSGTVNGVHFKGKDETGAQPFNLYGDFTIDDGDWNHIVCIYDTDSAYLYINTELDKSGPASGEPIGFTEDPLLIGAKFEATYRNSWNGLIDDVRIYDYALTAEQVDSLYYLEISSKVNRNSKPVSTFQLEQNYPNPFNPSTTISYNLTQPDNVRLRIYDMLGTEIATLVNGEQQAGVQHVVWNGTDNLGHAVSSGVYLYQLESGDQIQQHKMLLIK